MGNTDTTMTRFRFTGTCKLGNEGDGYRIFIELPAASETKARSLAENFNIGNGKNNASVTLDLATLQLIE
jgi:hypothetical protein